MKAKIDGIEITIAARWAKNGRKYEWREPTQEQLDRLVEEYGIDQITEDGVCWLQW